MSTWFQVVAIVVAALAAFAPVSRQVIERRFSSTVYPQIQHVVTPLSNLVPFALFDVFTVCAAAALVTVAIRAARQARRQRRVLPLVVALRRIVMAAVVIYLVFLAVWGLNYRRTRMDERLVMTNPAPTTEAVVSLGLEAVRRVNALYSEAHRTGWAGDPRHDANLVDAFAAVQRRLIDAPVAVPGRLKRSLYGPYFRWTSVDGMVNPFGLEVLANPDLLPFERPMVAAHEWAHLAGFADESEANFVGWLTCVRAEAPAQYSGWSYLYWQVNGELAPPDRMRLWDALDAGPRRDMEAIVDRIRRGQLPFLRNASWLVYDHYLRANRVQEGVRSYGEVITLILRARFDDGWNPVRREPNASSR